MTVSRVHRHYAGIHWLVVFKHTVNPLTSYIKSC